MLPNDDPLAALLEEGPDSFLARTMQDAWEAVAPVDYHKFVRERIRELLNDSTASARFIADVEKPWREALQHQRWRNHDFNPSGCSACEAAYNLMAPPDEYPGLLATTPSAEGK